jgi:hypothetical protein
MGKIGLLLLLPDKDGFLMVNPPVREISGCATVRISNNPPHPPVI